MSMNITEFAKIIGVIPDTVRRWERSGKITADRTVGGHRRFTDMHVQQALRLKMQGNILQGIKRKPERWLRDYSRELRKTKSATRDGRRFDVNAKHE
jgi:excisionase family DNA binding protein